jgi:hypothetical protein
MSKFDIPERYEPLDNLSPQVQKLALHVEDLARAFDVDLLLTPVLRRERAAAIRHPWSKRRAVLAHPVTDETSYAVVLHEMGHHCAVLGHLRADLMIKTPGRFAPREEVMRYLRVMLEEERAAWDWARHYALYWTPAMMQVESIAYDSYESPLKRMT